MFLAMFKCFPPPNRHHVCLSCVAVKELPYGSDIEIKCVAVVSDKAS